MVRPDDITFRSWVLEVRQAVVQVVEGTDRLVRRTITQHDQIARDRHGRFRRFIGYDWHLDAAQSLDLLLDGRCRRLVDIGRWCHDRNVRLAFFDQGNIKMQVLQLAVLRRDRRGRWWRRRREATDKFDVGDQHLRRRVTVSVQVDHSFRRIWRCRAFDRYFGKLVGKSRRQASLHILTRRKEPELQVRARCRGVLHAPHFRRYLIRLAAFQIKRLKHTNLCRRVAVDDQQSLPAVRAVCDLQFLARSATAVLRPAQRNPAIVHAFCEGRILKRYFERFFRLRRHHGQQDRCCCQHAVQVRQSCAHIRLSNQRSESALLGGRGRAGPRRRHCMTISAASQVV